MYIKAKDGKLYKIWSDNIEEQTMNCIPIENENSFDIEFDSLSFLRYDEIAEIADNYRMKAGKYILVLPQRFNHPDISYYITAHPINRQHQQRLGIYTDGKVEYPSVGYIISELVKAGHTKINAYYEEDKARIVMHFSTK
jgi:hypothetical protein